MNLLFTSIGNFLSLEAQTYLAEWRARSHVIERMPVQYVVPYLRFHPASALALIDAIVCMADTGFIATDEDGVPALDFPLEKALRLASDIRSLPGACTMRDGRKWNATPFIIFCQFYSALGGREGEAVHVFATGHPQACIRQIRRVVDDYHNRVLQEYENLGIMVRFEKGRAQIGPALKLKKRITEGQYYYAPGDRRNNRGWVTVKRDDQGLRNDVDLLQMLLDRNASETEMHRFFEEHPAILMEARLGIPISHQPTFIAQRNQKPDFAFHSILGPWNDRKVDFLELKGPADGTLTGRIHRSFTAKVCHAIAQVRDYGYYLHDPANVDAIRRTLGYVPDDSNHAVLIGRAPKETDNEVWARRELEFGVQVITYDEILQKQAEQISGPYRLRYGTEGYPLD